VSKPSAPRAFFPALWFPAIWIIAILIAAVAAVVVAAPLPARRQHASVAATAASPTPAANPAVRNRIQATYAALPLAFEANQGQADPQVKYMARGQGYKLFLTSSHAVMTLSQRRPSEVLDMMMNKRRGAAAAEALRKKRAQRRAPESTAVLRMNLLGPKSHAQLVAEDLQPGKVNYFIGRDQSKWRSNIPLYGRVSYRGVYPGVDLAFHGLSKQLEFDYLVSPGADAASIALNIEGAQSIHTDDTGNLILETTAGPVQLHQPVAYQNRIGQEKTGTREPVDARFVLKANNEVGFALAPYDHNRELVIDPVVTYSTYFGGSSADYGIAIAVDSSGNSYVAGASDSTTIPASASQGGSVQLTPQKKEFAYTFVTEISPTGTCAFTTFFGGSSDDFPGGIAVDSQGIYVAGTTDSDDFPVTNNAVQPGPGGGPNGSNSGYAVKLALSGGAIVWATYIEGSDDTTGLGLAVDSGHNLYVVGQTFASDLGGGPVNPLPKGNAINLGTGSGATDGYIVKLMSDGTAYLLVSYIGGSAGDLATGVSLDGAGNIYVSGITISNDFPATPGAVQTTCGTDGNCNPVSGNPQDDAFVVSIKANLSGYNYATYYGGSAIDDALAIAADSTGNAFLTGRTSSSDFPLSGTPYQGSLAGTQNAFVVELNKTGTAATQSTYFGGNGTDYGFAIALDGSDNVYLTGQTSSSKFPVTANASGPSLSGPTDAFVSTLNLSSSSLLFSTYLGGGGDEDQYFSVGIGLDGSNNVYVTGDTDSGNGSTAKFPTTAALDGTYGGTGSCTNSLGAATPCPDAFIAAFTPTTTADFGISATTPAAVSPGSSGMSTVTLTAVNGYTLAVNLACSVSGGGSPAPTCSASSFSTNPQTPTGPGATSILTVTTTGKTAALYGAPKIFYALWLPIVGLSLVGMRFSTDGSRRSKLLGFLLLGVVMSLLSFLPACSSSSGGGGGGGCTGCTPAGGYTVTITGTDANNLSHSTQVTLTVN